MCYGGLDPKFQMRDIEARMKTLSFEHDKPKLTAPVPPFGLPTFGRIIAWMLRKGPKHV